MLDVADYELAWPPDVFAAEAGRLLTRPRLSRPWIDLLLREAFRDENAAEDLPSLADENPWGTDLPSRTPREVLAELAGMAHQLRRSSAPRPYWPQRQARQPPDSLDPSGARRAFVGVVAELERHGYLEQVFPRPCVDDQDEPEPDPAVELEKRLGIAGLWPLMPDQWDDGTFYGLIEVYHDLVSRPRERLYHDYGSCGWHYNHFSVTAGREVYRWKVNEVLQAGGIGYRLADSGEDQGRLVATFDDGRSALLAEAISHDQPDTVTRVQHAIALFRKRDATAEDKRSALVALAGILEERRQLVKAELGSADEGALFHIANKFAIRHQNKDQQGDYDPAFQDWIFWWYLATVELTDRVIRRQENKSVWPVSARAESLRQGRECSCRTITRILGTQECPGRPDCPTA